MPSITQLALGDEFGRLHPKLQKQYAITSESELSCTGKGTMSEVTRGAFYVLPFLRIGARRFVLFPESGTDVPFTIENYAFKDDAGRETLTWTRTFRFPKERRFDEYLVYNEKRKALIVYAGSHQHLAVDLKLTVDEGGALCFETGAQRVYESWLALRFPMFLSGTATVRESYNDELERYEISVTISSRIFGHIFGYSGWFTLDQVPCAEVPRSALPKRTEIRD